MASHQQLISAQVILQPPKNTAHHGQVNTSDISKPLSGEEAAATVMVTFKKLGFQTGHFAGNSFSITAPVSTFEKIFIVRIVTTKKDVHYVQWKDGALKDHFPLPELPESIAQLIMRVVLTPAPHFGPASY